MLLKLSMANGWQLKPGHIIKHFKVDESLKFDGSQLVKALGLKCYASLNSEMFVADHHNIPSDHIDIFHDTFHQHGKHRVH